MVRGTRARWSSSGAPARVLTVPSPGAIAQSGNQAINYFIAQEYTKAVAKFADSPNAKTILFPIEATQLIGTLGGIGALAKEALGGDKPTPPPPPAPRRPGPFEQA